MCGGPATAHPLSTPAPSEGTRPLPRASASSRAVSRSLCAAWSSPSRADTRALAPLLGVEQALLEHNSVKIVLPGSEDSLQSFPGSNCQNNGLVTVGRQPWAAGLHQSWAAQHESNGEGRPGHPSIRNVEVSKS